MVSLSIFPTEVGLPPSILSIHLYSIINFMEHDRPETPLNAGDEKTIIIRPPRPRCCTIPCIVAIVVVAAIIGGLGGAFVTTHISDIRRTIPRISVGPMIMEDFPASIESALHQATWNMTMAVRNENLDEHVKLVKCSVKILYNDEQISENRCSNKDPLEVEPNDILDFSVSSKCRTKKMWRDRERGSFSLDVKISFSIDILSKGNEGPNEFMQYMCDSLVMKFSETTTTGKASHVSMCAA